jgi:hypothetical protein
MCQILFIHSKVQGKMIIVKKGEAAVPYSTFVLMNHKARFGSERVWDILRDGSEMDHSRGAIARG